jgi:hypothetical protein
MLNVGSISIRILRSVCQVQRCDQTIRVDRVGQRLKQLEGPESASEELQAMPVGSEYPQDGGPLFGDLAQQLEPGAVFETLGGDDDLKCIRTQQFEAVALVRYGIDSVKIPERSGDRFIAGGILVDDEHTHAGKLPAWP